MKFKTSKILQKSSITLIFVLSSLTIGDFHPFARFNMYSSFPNWAYFFYITDQNEEVIPLQEYFNTFSGELSHDFSAYCNFNSIMMGIDLPPTQNKSIGDKMLHNLFNKRNS
ncbi:MAG: hypothetical protein AAF502_15645 [Bacteroidota bacterium]